MHIAISTAERAVERLTDQHVQQAAQTLAKEGFVVLNQAVAHSHLDILHEQMLIDTHTLVGARDRGEEISGWKYGHLQQKPPHQKPYIFRDIVANPFAVQVTRSVLGEGLFNAFYSGNTNLPGSEDQPLHRDALPLWPNWNTPHPATTLVVNISPIDINPHNGSTEIWPGSHQVVGALDEALIEKQRAIAPPIRVKAKKGSILIRDIRLWHRGVPNQSDQIRHMIAMVHQVRWFHKAQTLQFPKGCEAEFANEDLDQNAEFIDGPVEYLFSPHLNHS
mgnify:FL=1